MGICFLQHRILTGSYNNFSINVCARRVLKEEMSVGGALLISITCAGLIMYMYILCLIMAMVVNITLTDPSYGYVSTNLSCLTYDHYNLRYVLNYMFTVVVVRISCQTIGNYSQQSITKSIKHYFKRYTFRSMVFQ